MYLPIKIIKVVPKMSFPPGPPIHIPGMPPLPPMIPPPYSVPPMGGMIPMTVGMMPGHMMAPVAMTMPAPLPMPPPTNKMPMKKMNTNHHNTIYKRDNSYETQELMKGPPVTVFVGNITERAPDNLIRQILQRCGIVLNWKRVQGANGKLQAFGFCEYGEPEAALRAIRLLHEWEIGNKKLVVKVDAKTKEKLDEYKAKIMAKQDGAESKEGKEGSKEGGNENEEKEEGEALDDTIDEATKQRDEIIRLAIEGLIRAHESELSKPVETIESPPPPVVHQPTNTEKAPTKNQNSESSPKPRADYERFRKNDLDEMDLEDDKRSLIHREIDKFRDTYKRAEEEKERDSGSSRDRRSSRRRDYESPESRFRDSREREREREREKRYHRDRGSQGRDREDSGGRRRRRSRERSTRSPRESPVVTREPKERSRERQVERPRSPSRDREYIRERDSNERSKDKEWDKEEEEEAYERKKLERKLREKEAIYQERLRNWEARERRRAKEYDKEKVKAEEQKKDEIKEARRLKEFLEDYDDERDDPKYFKGSSLLRRMKEREKEIEEDLLDRQREKEELDELRKKLAEEGHPDPEAEVERFLQEESRLVEPPLKEATPDSDQEVEAPPAPVVIAAKMKPIPKIPVSPPEPVETVKHQKPIVAEDDSTQNSFSGFSDFVAQEEAKPMGFTSLRIGGSPTQTVSSPATSQSANAKDSNSNSKRKMTIDEVFNSNDDEPEQKKKRKLIPLDDSQEDASKIPGSVSQMTIEEKRKHIKNLIDKIPTEKNELFAYTLDWTMVDKVLMEKRIRPWINKKIIEYIGEEEPTLVEFICSKIMAGSAAQSILDDVSMVLDDEAEVFVVKMWRLLIYEIEAKKLGLQESLSLGKS